MSDERQEPPTGDHDGDETQPLPRSAEEPSDRTQRLPGPGGSADANQIRPASPAPSRPGPAGGTTPPGRPVDETSPLGRRPDETAPRGPDETAPLGRPADRTAPLPPERSAPWSGRAEVPPPRPADYRDPAAEWYAEDPGGRRWWLPILWGVLALLLVVLLGTAVWLVLSADDDRPGPEPTLSPSLTTAARTSAAATSQAPTSEPPSSAPPTTEAAGTPVPPVTGLPHEAAESLLDQLGIRHRVQFRPSELPPGVVISSEPGQGELVADDEEVLLLVSQADLSPSPSPETSTPTPTMTITF